MILVDSRIGSKDMLGHLRYWGVACESTRLEYGDAVMLGNGPDGPISIGVEVKAIRDALSCMTDGRFAGHQLPGLVRTYERVYLVLEGHAYPRHSDGVLQVGRPGSRQDASLGSRRFMYRDLDNWITSMETCAGIKIRRTSDRIETARCIADLAAWWGKRWDEHRAHLAFDESRPDTALLVKPGFTRRVAAELPHIGWEKSDRVASHFRTVARMVRAEAGEWEQIDGIGKKIAQGCWDALHKEK